MNSQLIDCPKWGHMLSDDAPSCTNCNKQDPFGRIAASKAEGQTKNLRRAWIFFALAVLSFVFIVIPIGKVVYDKFTQNGKIPIHFISAQLKVPQ
jgi:ABC-type Fe3+ transport system permease subunit